MSALLLTLPQGSGGYSAAPGGAPNLFRYSEQFNQSVWEKYSPVVTANAAVAPDGASTADKIAASSAADSGHVMVQAPVSALGPHIIELRAKAAELTQCRLTIFTGGAMLDGYVNLTTGAMVSVAQGTFDVASLGNGWWRIRGSYTATDVVQTFHFNLAIAGSHILPGVQTGNGVYLWGAQLTRGAAPQPYQVTV